MPARLGYYHQGQSPDAAYAALDSAHIEDGIDGQADAAVETIAKLAADAGHPIVVSAKDAGSGSDRSRRDRLIILLAGVALAQPSPSDSYYVDESPADGSSTIALLLV